MLKLTASQDVSDFLRSSNKEEARQKIGIQDEIISTLTAAERKALTTYDPDGPVVGQTRVIQTDIPGILWNLVAADVTLDSSWIGIPYTVDPDGNVIVSMELANVTGTVPDVNVLGVAGGVPSIGDGVSIGGHFFWDEPDLNGYVRVRGFSETSASITVRHDGGAGANGIRRSLNGAAASNVSVAADTDHIISGLVGWFDLVFWPVIGSGSASSGSITHISHQGSLKTASWHSGGMALQDVRYARSRDPVLNLQGSKASLRYLFLDSPSRLNHLDLSDFTGFNGSNSPEYAILITGAGQLRAVTLPLVPFNVGEFMISNNPLLAGHLDLTKFSGTVGVYQQVSVSNNPLLTSVDISGITADKVDYVDLSNNGLIQVTANGFNGSSHSVSYYGTDLKNNALTTDAVYDMLDQMAVAYVTGSGIQISGNPCVVASVLQDGIVRTAAETSALAASKNYTLVLS